MLKPRIKIDVVSDVVCPWCYIGKRRLERAVDLAKDKYEFELEYHPFELNPDMPVAGKDQKKYLTNKFGGTERYQQIINRVTAVALEEGLHFDFEKQKISPNTRDAHRVIQFAKQAGKQVDVKEAFMKAYFIEGVDLSKKENLIDVSVKAGLLIEEVEKLLSTKEGMFEVTLAEKELQKLGITGVPFFIINNQYGISGAQPSEAFMQAFEDIDAKTQFGDEVCDVKDKNC